MGLEVTFYERLELVEAMTEQEADERPDPPDDCVTLHSPHEGAHDQRR